jgi:hypothetical protein
MKKFVVGIAVVAGVCFAMAAFAAGTGTPSQPAQEKITKEKVKGSTTTKAGETDVTATAKENLKGGEVVKEKVIFNSYTEADGGTITVVKENKEVKMPARHAENWKANIIGKEKKEVTITSSYDPKLMKYVVTHVEPVEKLK